MNPQQLEHLHAAAELATRLEPRFRELGYHLGLTGSSLYGKPQPPYPNYVPRDIDLFCYWHSDIIKPDLTPQELLGSLSIKFTEALPEDRRDYPTSRTVLKSSWQGRRIDFIFFTPATASQQK